MAYAATAEGHRTPGAEGNEGPTHLGFELLAFGMREADCSFSSHPRPPPSSWSAVTAAL